jgi:hypothetical protein
VVAGGDRVACQLGELRPGVLAFELLERLDRELVQPYTAGAREAVVERVADEHVLEAQAPGRARNVGDHACGDRLVEPLEQLVV